MCTLFCVLNSAAPKIAGEHDGERHLRKYETRMSAQILIGGSASKAWSQGHSGQPVRLCKSCNSRICSDLR